MISSVHNGTHGVA